MSERPPKPANTPWLSPYLVVKDVDRAIDFYSRAFGFEKQMVLPGPDGKPAHAEMRYQGMLVMMGPESGNNYGKAPSTLGGTVLTLYLYTEDVDALYDRATKAGAKSVLAPENMFWGDRVCLLTDPDGHAWNFATNVADPDFSKAPH